MLQVLNADCKSILQDPALSLYLVLAGLTAHWPGQDQESTQVPISSDSASGPLGQSEPWVAKTRLKKEASTGHLDSFLMILVTAATDQRCPQGQNQQAFILSEPGKLQISNQGVESPETGGSTWLPPASAGQTWVLPGSRSPTCHSQVGTPLSPG